MSTEMLAKLKKLVQRECWTDSIDFDPCLFSGGNYDDAYLGGYADGHAKLAQEILKELELPVDTAQPLAEEPPF